MPEVPALAGRFVRLEPLTEAHGPALLAAGAEDRATYAYAWVPQDDADLERYFARAFGEREAGLAVPFATVAVAVASGAGTDRVVGSTRFMNLEHWPEPYGPAGGGPAAAEIGATWLAASAQRTPINTEAKLLMLTWAFETWGVRRLQIKTDARNARSRAAIARLGAAFEGVLRNHMPSYEGPFPRDSAMYSIVPDEWPAIRARLVARLDAA